MGCDNCYPCGRIGSRVSRQSFCRVRVFVGSEDRCFISYRFKGPGEADDAFCLLDIVFN